jgi:hypothetical protein
MKQLPLKAFEELESLFGCVDKHGQWPQHGLVVPIGLLDKPDGGDRPIGITPMLSALYMRTKGPIIDTWESEHMNFWEDAVKGSSALQAALNRRLLDETSVA